MRAGRMRRRCANIAGHRAKVRRTRADIASSGHHMPEFLPKSGGAVATELLDDLAAASRILAMQNVVDGFGHVSMRHPAAPDRYLMARSIAPALVTRADLIEYDLDSNACDANGRASFIERFIHG